MTAAMKFEVTSLDLSGLTDEDLADTGSNKPFMKFLKEKGTYGFTIIEASRTKEDKLDGAGKKWGSMRILASTDGPGATTGLIKGFLDVPLESALYTSKAGSTSNVKTKIFVRAIESVTGTKVLTADIPSTVSQLDSILVPGATFRASVAYKGDRITRENDKFYITLLDGARMVDVDGTVISFDDYESTVSYYQTIKNRKPVSSMEIVSFLARTGE